MAEADFFAGKRICIAGPRGMVGSAILRALADRGGDVLPLGREQADLRDQAAVRRWFSEYRPDLVFLAAAKVGGIAANNEQPADFLYDNLMIEANIIHASHEADVTKLLFLGSSCIYPKFAPQPIPESALMTGVLEPTNEWYAIAKIAGIKLCEAYRVQHGRNFISAMPTNLYGPGDNFDLHTSHVLPALISKILRAKAQGADSVEVWGTGRPLREFLHVDDLADAALFLMERYSDRDHINVGSGQEIAIGELAHLIGEVVGYSGAFRFDPTMPDGTPRKLLDCSRLTALGWTPSIKLRDGIAQVAALVAAQSDRRNAA